MTFKLLKLTSADLGQFETDMQEAFNKGAEYYSGREEHVLPKADIEESLNAKGATAYKAMMGKKMIGGAIVNIDPLTEHNHLDFLYVKAGYQGKRI
ncbi:MAG: GNAT family N-acetyltransferase, partial [Limosilactobacillus sp.]